MAPRAELKQRAKDQLGNSLFSTRWLMMLAAFLVYELLVGLVSGTFPYSAEEGVAISAVKLVFNLIFVIAYIILTGPLAYGVTRIATKAARNNEQADLNELFSGFKEGMSDAILLGFMRALLIFLWTLLLIIPGIIKSYAYSMASYIQQDDKNKDWNYCIKKSMEITKGHKWELFVLDLSFIGWYIVGALCFGVGLLWVTPYHQMTKANFYLELVKGNAPVDDEDGEVIDGEVTDKEAKVFD